MKRYYTQAQLNAISRYYTEKRRREWEQKAEEYGILKAFNKQKQYKTIRGYVLAYERKTAETQEKEAAPIPKHDEEYYHKIFAGQK